jgi:hypothetical protein
MSGTNTPLLLVCCTASCCADVMLLVASSAPDVESYTAGRHWTCVSMWQLFIANPFTFCLLFCSPFTQIPNPNVSFIARPTFNPFSNSLFNNLSFHWRQLAVATCGRYCWHESACSWVDGCCYHSEKAWTCKCVCKYTEYENTSVLQWQVYGARDRVTSWCDFITQRLYQLLNVCLKIQHPICWWYSCLPCLVRVQLSLTLNVLRLWILWTTL